METFRISVLVSGNGSNLQCIIDAVEDGRIANSKIVGVISSSENAYALERAAKAGIPGLEINKKACGGQVAFEQKLIDALTINRIDLIVLAGFLVVIPPEMIEKYERRIINIHPSLIPSFCGDGYYGLHVHEKVLARGVKVTGATVHFVDAGTDTGPILLQKAVDAVLWSRRNGLSFRRPLMRSPITA